MPDVREKLVDIVQQSVGGCSRYWAGVIADGLMANGVTIQRWIPVEERLPESSGEVLVWRVTPLWRTYDIMRFTDCLESVDDVEFKGQKRGGFYSYDNGIFEARDVTHWMPLPEPPKEEEDDRH